MKNNKQTHSTKTYKKLININVRHIPDSGQYITVTSNLSTEYEARHKNSEGSGGALKPQANPPDTRY